MVTTAGVSHGSYNLARTAAVSRDSCESRITGKTFYNYISYWWRLMNYNWSLLHNIGKIWKDLVRFENFTDLKIIRKLPLTKFCLKCCSFVFVFRMSRPKAWLFILPRVVLVSGFTYWVTYDDLRKIIFLFYFYFILFFTPRNVTNHARGAALFWYFTVLICFKTCLCDE